LEIVKVRLKEVDGEDGVYNIESGGRCMRGEIEFRGSYAL